MGMWRKPLTNTPSIMSVPMAELERENLNFAKSGKKAQIIPTHRRWENLKRKTPTI